MCARKIIFRIFAADITNLQLLRADANRKKYKTKKAIIETCQE